MMGAQSGTGATTLLGLGEFGISNTPGQILCTPNLGSCLGVTMYDHRTGWGAMAHFVLPTASTNPEKAAAQPCNYADSGFVYMLGEMIKRGSAKKDLVVCCAGGANIADTNNVFEIGKRNHTIFRKLMWKNSMLIKAEHIGDAVSRTVSLHIGTGMVTVKVRGEIVQLA